MSTPASPKKKTSLPKKIGPYNIQSLLSKKNAVKVFLASDPKTQLPIVIKTLSKKHLSDPSVADRFLQESKITELTDHKNIVKVLDHGQWEQGLYLCMEFIQGMPLTHFISSSPLPYKKALETVLQIAHAITHMHGNGIVHCDITPENILLDSKGRVKIIDFGIAQMQNKSLNKQSSSPLFAGTPGYLSPEQEKNPQKVSYSWDIYALGVITYELLTRKVSKSSFSLDALPKGILPIVTKAIEPSPKKRYEDIVDFITDLSLYLNSAEFRSDENKANTQKNTVQTVKEEQKRHLFCELPDWPRVEIGLYNHETSHLSGIYFEFLQLEEGISGILLAESNAKGIDAVFFMSYLKGAVKAICPLVSKPSQMMRALNEQIFQEKSFDFVVSLSFLSLNPASNQFHFISCGYGPLWQIAVGSNTPKLITTDNIGLGIDPSIDFLEVHQKWAVGDTLVLQSLRASQLTKTKEEEGVSQSEWQTMLVDSLYLEPQRQVEKIFSKLLKGKHPKEIKKPFILLSIQRKH